MARVSGTCGPYVADLINPKLPSPWVARITGLCARYGFSRDFVRYITDYSECNGIGSRGVYAVYTLAETQCAKCKNMVPGATRYTVRRPGCTAWIQVSTLAQARRERDAADNVCGHGHIIIDQVQKQIVE